MKSYSMKRRKIQAWKTFMIYHCRCLCKCQLSGYPNEWSKLWVLIFFQNIESNLPHKNIIGRRYTTACSWFSISWNLMSILTLLWFRLRPISAYFLILQEVRSSTYTLRLVSQESYSVLISIDSGSIQLQEATYV